ncbi:uncharacterized protein LOC126248444 isoform X1 [Schistocerca nitens]|uniref:uncharacterized protein LOC126248444 isoform X1 n=1 Tax=Schistocerca nitens TaxID=7011 RepID=UPI002117AEB2|nr:uncharacterized protein LOC126248444 isoform X1 [Schistocerca nitens]
MCRLLLPPALSWLVPLPLLLVLATEICALPPPREISPRRTAFGAVYRVNDGSVRAYGPSQWHNPMSNVPVRQSATEENFSPSIHPYASGDFPRFPHGAGGNPRPQHNHEKIVSANSGEPEGTVRREVTPIREYADSSQGQRNSILRTTASPVFQDSGILRRTSENHRPDSRASYPETVDRRSAGDIVFPDKALNFTPKEDVKNCSEDGTSICDKNVRDYPYHYIEEVIANSAYDFSSYFQDDHIYEDVATRIDADANDDSVCDSEETVLYPKVGQNADDRTLFIVNNDGNYKQGVRVEKCRRKEQSPCDPKLVVPTGFKTHCKQKYIYRKLLALQPNGEPVPDNFRIPSCCSCYISKDLATFRGLFGPKDQQQTPSVRQ